jgi:flagellar hook protein FlgE
MKAFADKISSTTGIKAYVATDDPYDASTADADVDKGFLRIESLIPGEKFNISSCGMIHASDNKQGTYAVDVTAESGEGLAALESARDALNMAITGKQRDVYTSTDLDTPDGSKDYSYQITIYDKGLEKNVVIPTTPLAITDPADVDAFVTAINDDEDFKKYIKAENINGVLVIKTLDSNFDVEYTGDMKRTDVAKDLKRNSDYSGREGAGAEFMEIKTRIDQTASKGKMQLRLDSLNISDSAFGDFKVDKTGLITMSQDGAVYAVGQVAIAKFITNRGLDPVGNNLLKKTIASGDPIFNVNNDKTAEIKSNTLELSTADLSESLVNLMVFQRAFEANAKSITTADTILNTLIQLKR